MTASAETRAKRRFVELFKNGQHVDYDAVLANIKSRDYKDSTRKKSPLKQAKDALVLDNSALTQSEQFDLVLGWINAKCQE
jgi:cytidylate kinase